jgi:hypothetical protein
MDTRRPDRLAETGELLPQAAASGTAALAALFERHRRE